jgi:hypothetical protein
MLIEVLNVSDVKLSPDIADDAGFLQRAGDCGHGAAPYTDHSIQIVLSNSEVIANQVAHPEKPARNPRLCRMARIARRRLLDIRDPELLVGGEHFPDNEFARINARKGALSTKITHRTLQSPGPTRRCRRATYSTRRLCFAHLASPEACLHGAIISQLLQPPPRLPS